VGCGPVECLKPGVHSCAHGRHPADRVVAGVQGDIVAGGLEHRQRPLEEGGQVLGRALRLEVEAEHARFDPRAQLADTIARGRGALGEQIRTSEPVDAPACPEQGVEEVGFEGEVDLGRRHERGGALEQAHGGAVV
jgi:hypothetical protein